jgi:hypothetical protein
MTPFEQGKVDGFMTLQDVHTCGFRSVQECLVHRERVYQEQLAVVASIQNPERAARHAQYVKLCLSALS